MIGAAPCGRLADMTRQNRPLPPDLQPTGDCADRLAAFGLQEQPLIKDAAPANEALLALARLLGRQAAHAFLRGKDEGGAGSPLARDLTDVQSQTPFPTAGTVSEADAASGPA